MLGVLALVRRRRPPDIRLVPGEPPTLVSPDVALVRSGVHEFSLT